MISIGIFAKTFQRNSVSEVFEAVKVHGFNHVQFNMACVGLLPMPDSISPQVLKEIQKASNTHNISILGLSATFNMCHPDISIRQEGLERLEILAASAHDIETNLITLCTGTRDPLDKWKYHPKNHSKEAWNDMLQSIEKAIEIAEKYNLFLGIEPEHANVVQNAKKAKELIKEMQSDRLKVILDPANLFERASLEQIKDLISEAIDQLAPYIMMVHAKDRDRLGNFVAPGKGIIPFDFMISKIITAGISPPLIAHGFSENEASFVSKFLHELDN